MCVADFDGLFAEYERKVKYKGCFVLLILPQIIIAAPNGFWDGPFIAKGPPKIDRYPPISLSLTPWIGSVIPNRPKVRLGKKANGWLSM